MTSATGRRALSHGVGPAFEHLGLLKAGWDTIIDIGANKGQFTAAARIICPQSTIHSIEPLDRPRQTFAALFEGDHKIFLHPVAIGPQAGHAEMHIAGRDDSSSLLPIGEGQISLSPETREIGREDVVVATLDSLLTRESIVGRALLKIDVQGYELEALKGCASLLDRFDAVYVECSFAELYVGQALYDDVVEWMAGQGFPSPQILTRTDDNDGKLVQADVLFERS